MDEWWRAVQARVSRWIAGSISAPPVERDDRRPPIRFLPRNHAVNRFLGRMQARVLGRAAWVAARVQGA